MSVRVRRAPRPYPVIIGIDFGSDERLAMALHFGGALISPDTCWPDLGCDVVRLQLFDEVERSFQISLTDEDREGVVTVGDFTALVESRATA